MTAAWRIGSWLNAIQTLFVGVLRVWSVPIVLMLSLASGYTTYYGLSFFITPWIALTVTVAVQSIVVICTLELAGMHWQANLPRYLAVAASLVVALIVSVSFSYFKFYEFSERENLLLQRQAQLEQAINGYLENVVALKSGLVSTQQARVEQASKEATQAYLGTHPAMQGQHKHVGRGPFWTQYNEIFQEEKNRLKTLDVSFRELDQPLAAVREALREFSGRMSDPAAFDRVTDSLQKLRGPADNLAATYGLPPVAAPRLGSYAEFSRAITPNFAMWENISLFPLACAGMVDFFVLVLSYRLETTAPGPLTDEEQELAYQGLKQFGEFTINGNDELEFVIEKTELERAKRYSDWTRMFAVAFLLNRGYLRKIGDRSVEFAPNLYPIIAERMRSKRSAEPTQPANEATLAEIPKSKHYG